MRVAGEQHLAAPGEIFGDRQLRRRDAPSTPIAETPRRRCRTRRPAAARAAPAIVVGPVANAHDRAPRAGRRPIRRAAGASAARRRHTGLGARTRRRPTGRAASGASSDASHSSPWGTASWTSMTTSWPRERATPRLRVVPWLNARGSISTKTSASRDELAQAAVGGARIDDDELGTRAATAVGGSRR